MFKSSQPFYLFIILFLAAQFTFAQDAIYKFPAQIEEKFAKSERESRFQRAAFEYTFIGEYRKANEKLLEDKNLVSRFAELTEQDTAYLKTFIPQPARKVILEQAKDKQIVIINENHTDPRHRVFTASLLSGLYQKGFRYLALEALEETGEKLAERGFPVVESGYYLNEPQMGNLVREALKIGFKIVRYESETHKDGEEREKNQAKNILTILAKDPQAKILVHCGHDHLYEGDYQEWGKAMAGRIKEFSNIDPLTVNQIQYTEGAGITSTQPALKFVAVSEPSVLMSAAGKVFTSLRDTRQWDMSVFHPFAEYATGRPDWLASDSQKKWHAIPAEKDSMTFPYLVLAYPENEPENAVPVDVIEIGGKNEPNRLSLFKGNYRLVFRDTTGKKISENISVR